MGRRQAALPIDDSVPLNMGVVRRTRKGFATPTRVEATVMRVLSPLAPES